MNPTKALAQQIKLLEAAGKSEADIMAVMGDRIKAATATANQHKQAVDPLVQKYSNWIGETGRVEKAMNSLGISMQSVKQIAGAFGLAISAVGIAQGIRSIIDSTVEFTKASVKMGMDAVESENLFTVSMGNMAESARAWSKELSASLGLNEYEIRKTVGTMNVMLTSLGLGSDAAYDMAKGLTQLAYDMASFYNLKPEEAFQKLQAGISGETEPLKRLGIIINETTVKAYAYKAGIAEVGKTLTEQEKVLARYGAIMEQTSAAQGDLARTAESPANAMRRLQSQIDELQTKIGEAFLPTISASISLVNEFVSALDVSGVAFEMLARLIAYPIAKLLAFGIAMTETTKFMIEGQVQALTFALAMDKALGPLSPIAAGREVIQRALAAATVALSGATSAGEAMTHSLEILRDGLNDFGKSAQFVGPTLDMLEKGLKKLGEERAAAAKKAFDEETKNLEMRIVAGQKFIEWCERETEKAAALWEKSTANIGASIDKQILKLDDFKAKDPLGALVPKDAEIAEAKKRFAEILTSGTDTASKLSKEVSTQISTVFSDMSKEIADSIVEWSNPAGTILDAVKSFGKAVLRILIEEFVNPFATAMAGVIKGALSWLGGGGFNIGGIPVGNFVTSALGGIGLGVFGGTTAAGAATTGTITAGAWGSYGVGGTAAGAGGGSFLGSLGAFATNPWTIGIAGAGALGYGLYKWITGKNAWEAGEMEIARDLGGINIGGNSLEAFAQALGISEPQAYPSRLDLMVSPQFLTFAYGAAQAQGKAEDFLSAISRIKTVMGTLDFRTPFEEFLKSGSAEALNKAYLDAFGPTSALNKYLPGLKSLLLDVEDVTEDITESAQKLGGRATTSLEAAGRAARDAAEGIAQVQIRSNAAFGLTGLKPQAGRTAIDDALVSIRGNADLAAQALTRAIEASEQLMQQSRPGGRGAGGGEIAPWGKIPLVVDLPTEFLGNANPVAFQAWWETQPWLTAGRTGAFGEASGRGGIVINYNHYGDDYGDDDFGERILKVLNEALRRTGGTASGATTVIRTGAGGIRVR